MRWLSELLVPRRSSRKPSPYARLCLEHLEDRTLLNAAPVIVANTKLTLNDMPTLKVSTLTPTASGFTAQFNRAFDPSVLNLYSGIDTTGLVLGPADVTLVGAQVGNVKGSIILGADNTSFSFVATGGPLSTDTYAVTMRSAVNGLLGTIGPSDLLDGNSDGTAGDNYTSSFGVAAASARIVSVPDFARGPGQAVVVPNDSGFGIPITISDGTGVTSLTFELRYDLALLNITGYMPNPDLTGTSTISGPVTLGYLQANVPATAPYGSKHLLELVNISVNGDAIQAIGDAAVHVVAFPGDTTGNGQVTSADAQRTLRVAVGLDNGFSAYQLADPRIVGDVNGDGRLNSADATRVLQKAVGMSVPAIPDVPNIGSLTVGGPDPYLNIPKMFTGMPGETITVPVLVDHPEGLDSFDLAITFDRTRLEAMNVQLGSLTSKFEIFLPVIDNATGNIIVGMSTISALGDVGPGSLVLITFRIKDNSPTGEAAINLRHDLNGVTTALSEGYLVLQPVPNNSAGDELDGAITVQVPLLPQPALPTNTNSTPRPAPSLRPVAVAHAPSSLKRVATRVPWLADLAHVLTQLLERKKR